MGKKTCCEQESEFNLPEIQKIELLVIYHNKSTLKVIKE